jgi:hypothetical protein
MATTMTPCHTIYAAFAFALLDWLLLSFSFFGIIVLAFKLGPRKRGGRGARNSDINLGSGAELVNA